MRQTAKLVTGQEVARGLLVGIPTGRQAGGAGVGAFFTHPAALAGSKSYPPRPWERSHAGRAGVWVNRGPGGRGEAAC